MTYDLCGKCLHAKSSHTDDRGFFMYCAVCFKLCDLEEYNFKHKPTDKKTVWEIASKKQ